MDKELRTAVVDDDTDSMESTTKEEDEEIEVDWKLFINKQNFKLLIMFLLMFALAFLAGYYVGYNNAIVEVTNIFTERFADCICLF